MSKWTMEEDALLDQVRPEMGGDCGHMFTCHTLSSVRTRAAVRKLKRKDRKRAARRPLLAENTTLLTTRIEFHDDEPLLIGARDKRTARQCFGFIKTGPVASVWHFASAIGATP